jgi:hypothetical protein
MLLPHISNIHYICVRCAVQSIKDLPAAAAAADIQIQEEQ